MQDDRAGERLERSRSLLVGLTVVDHDGELELIRELELCVEQLPLLDRRRVPANRVEPGLADRDHLRMAEKLAKLVESVRLRTCAAWCGSMPSAANTPSFASAMASAARQESIPVPIVTIRVTPASHARSTRIAAGSSHASRCACESVTRRWRPPSARAPPRRPAPGRAWRRAASAHAGPVRRGARSAPSGPPSSRSHPSARRARCRLRSRCGTSSSPAITSS